MFKMEEDKLIMILQLNQIFIGKCRIISPATQEESFYVGDTVEILKLIRPDGITFIGTLLGDLHLDFVDDFLVIDVDSKSHYYSEYFRVTSNLTIPGDKTVNPLRRLN